MEPPPRRYLSVSGDCQGALEGFGGGGGGRSLLCAAMVVPGEISLSSLLRGLVQVHGIDNEFYVVGARVAGIGRRLHGNQNMQQAVRQSEHIRSESSKKHTRLTQQRARVENKRTRC
jgi:hypothetical protein